MAQAQALTVDTADGDGGDAAGGLPLMYTVSLMHENLRYPVVECRYRYLMCTPCGAVPMADSPTVASAHLPVPPPA